MKKLHIVTAMAFLCAGLCGCTVKAGAASWILIVLSLLILAFGGLRAYNMIQYDKRQRQRKRKPLPQQQYKATGIVLLVGLLVLIVAFLTMCSSDSPEDPATDAPAATTPTEPTQPPVLFKPQKTSASDPANWGASLQIYINDSLTAAYSRDEKISFGDPEEYFALPGISTFRGNNYRNSATYGTATVTQKRLSPLWNYKTSTLAGSSWSGSGWTGQPLIVKWDEETKNNMNLYPDKQAKKDLVEIIYATLDGHIYFLDLQDGTQTRDPLNIGMCFKGAGSLDPRGLPLLYVGSGDVNSKGDRPRMFIISLIDGKVLLEMGHNETIAPRTDTNAWCAFDSAPLVHGDTDTLIWPGENGVLYTMKLGTRYDADAGTISITPSNIVKTTYDTTRSSNQSYWYGMEASCSIVENYLYISENGGMFFCIDLNTMKLVWAQDTKDDSNSSPVFERISEEEGYIYTAPSLHWTRDSNMEGTISIYKLNAITGEIVWEKPYDVHTVDKVSGGVQSTALLGKPGTNLEGIIIYTIARTPNEYTGYTVALDTETGEELWRLNMNNYAWSSPVAFYTADGDGYVAVCDAMGYLFLLEGSTGRQLDLINLGGLIEASPAVYENTLVVGTRKEKICAVNIK
ncbi:MAG: PQQ-binding-like beta-propeller repeat protein [Oscillospiraceae bacterium]|nr:PQQ-binding-like beta-propeller repeat protein [Oscillospiraceae bacterium]